MPGKTDRVKVRVRPETHRQLFELRDAMAAAVAEGRAKQFWKTEELTICDVVAVLVERELAHRRRSRLSAVQRRRSAAGGKATRPDGVNDQVLQKLDPLDVIEAGLKKLEGEIEEMIG